VIPISNLATGTPDGTKFIRDDGTLAYAMQGAVAGMVVQVVNVETGAYATGTTAIPNDDTIPQNNEGTEVMTLPITPTSATSKLKIDVLVNMADANWSQDIVALYQDSIAGALACVQEITGGTNAGTLKPMVLSHFMTAGTTSPITFKVRIGADGNAVYFNGVSAARKFGGVLPSSITITEIKG